jgi:3-hydroxyacyl-CoA dehydrogenase/enoyl-CoA hydratase/3-hydroxybutyryl-CoA epimerase
MDNFKIDIDADGIALVLFDVPGKSMNTIGPQVMDEMLALAERLKTDAAIKGAVIASGKASGFCAGADLDTAAGFAGAGELDAATRKRAFDEVFKLSAALRAIETCGKPVAVALEGLAVGGGFEIALAGHRRIVADDNKIQLGLVEAKVGLMPGGGGSQRLPRLIGVMAAAPLLLQGKTLRPQEAKAQGLVHEVVAPGQTVEAAKAWLKGGGADPVAPWDKRDFKIPGGGPYTPQGFQMFVMGSAMLRKDTYGNYGAQINILKAVYEGLQVPIDAALRIEARYFVRTLTSPQAGAMVRTLFGSMQALGKGAARPAGEPPSQVKKAGVLGAGMMGAGIAHAQALAGIETVLIDVAQEAADKGKAHVKDLLDKAVSRGRMTVEKAAAALALVTPTTDYALLSGADIVIEAVFEDRKVKAEVTAKAEAVLGDTAVFGSNTSTLPITGLAEASVRPESFIGIHFFSPVDKMGLVEIILGKKTSKAALAKTIDYVLRIKKTPIVVNDSRGFYTSRCFMTFLDEGMHMLAEGIAPAMIDNVGRMTGMPRGPLEMADDVALDLCWKIVSQTEKDLGEAAVAGPTRDVLKAMVVDQGRLGRKNAKGFYDYPADKGAQKMLWPGLAGLFPVKTARSSPELVAELKTRLLYRQALEAARCFEEGVVTDPRDADVGAILGWGFAPWSGGPLSLIEQVGVAAFVAECERMTAMYGPRFAPPKLLKDMAAEGRGFYGKAKTKAA